MYCEQTEGRGLEAAEHLEAVGECKLMEIFPAAKTHWENKY